MIGQLDQWAREKGLSYTISFCEPDGCYEIKILSAAESENFYVKRCYNFDNFFQWYNERDQKD